MIFVTTLIKTAFFLLVISMLCFCGCGERQNKNVVSIIAGFGEQIISGKGIFSDFYHRGKGTVRAQFPSAPRPRFPGRWPPT